MRHTVRACLFLMLLLIPLSGWSQAEVFSACVFPTVPLGSDPQVAEFSEIIQQALAQNLRHEDDPQGAERGAWEGVL